jgi:hypothetical protein
MLVSLHGIVDSSRLMMPQGIFKQTSDYRTQRNLPRLRAMCPDLRRVPVRGPPDPHLFGGLPRSVVIDQQNAAR